MIKFVNRLASLRKDAVGESLQADETCNNMGRNGKMHHIGLPG